MQRGFAPVMSFLLQAANLGNDPSLLRLLVLWNFAG